MDWDLRQFFQNANLALDLFSIAFSELKNFPSERCTKFLSYGEYNKDSTKFLILLKSQIKQNS